MNYYRNAHRLVVLTLFAGSVVVALAAGLQAKPFGLVISASMLCSSIVLAAHPPRQDV